MWQKLLEWLKGDRAREAAEAPEPPTPSAEPLKGTWRQLEAKRKALAETAEKCGQGFAVSAHFERKLTGGANKQITSWLTGARDPVDIFMVIQSRKPGTIWDVAGSASMVELNYDEALALYRAMVPLFGDRATCAGCASLEKMVFQGLQVWCPKCEREVVLMGDKPSCPHCQAGFTRAGDAFLVLPGEHNCPSAVPSGEAKTEKKEGVA